jgi:polysaccharide export outer membrane protein
VFRDLRKHLTVAMFKPIQHLTAIPWLFGRMAALASLACVAWLCSGALCFGGDGPQHDQLKPRLGTVDDSAHLKDDYILGPDDQLLIHVANSDEFSDAPIPVDGDGSIKVPVVGRMRAAGLTTIQFEEQLTQKLQVFYKRPDVSVSVAEFRSQPVSVTGAVGKPGVVQVKGRHTLMEMIAEAGGLREDAGSFATVTRRAEWGTIPLPRATSDASQQFNIVRINLRDVTEAKRPLENIVIMPFDVISVAKADQVFVVGDVEKAGGFLLSDKEAVSALQALALAGGPKKTASLKGARILRASEGDGARTPVPVDLKAIMAGKDKDATLFANDVLFIPNSAQKVITDRAIEVAIGLATGILVWGRY